MQPTSQLHCSCGDLLTGNRRPFTKHLLQHRRRAGLRTHQGGRCRVAWRSDGPSHDAATDSILSSDSPHTRSEHRSQQFVEVSAAPAPPQQQLSAFLGTPKGAATAIALAGVTGLGLKALFSRGSRQGCIFVSGCQSVPDSIAETDRPHAGSAPHLAASACRAYADGSSVGNEYDAWTNEGILEAYWGEHIHLGYYNEQVADADD